MQNGNLNQEINKDTALSPRQLIHILSLLPTMLFTEKDNSLWY